MILPNRPYKREAPSKDAKSVFIFCEGKRREYQYFRYFRELDTRINIEVYELHEHEDNSPLGLFNIAKESIIKSDDNPDPKYNFIEGDEVWIVFDRDLDKLDSRAPQIAAVKESCSKTDGWNHAISNPCFEVWLYYHEYSDMPNDMSASPSWWKQLVADNIKVGLTHEDILFLLKQQGIILKRTLSLWMTFQI